MFKILYLTSIGTIFIAAGSIPFLAMASETFTADLLLSGTRLIILFLVLAALWQIIRRRVVIAVVAAAAGIADIALITSYTGAPRLFSKLSVACDRPLHVATLNVLGDKIETGRISGYLENRSSLDIVFLQEVTRWRNRPQWQEFLDRLKPTFPFQVARSDVAIVSRLAFETPDPVLQEALRKSFLARFTTHAVVSVQGTEIALISAHLHSPTSQARYESRNRQLAELGSALSGVAKPVILGADLNAVPWNPNVRSFFSRSNLKYVEFAGLAISTRPSWLPVLGAQIDYLAPSSEYFAGIQFVGPDVGSDHRPLEAHLCLMRT